MRFSTLLIVLFWLASMSWLAWEKLLPPLIGGKAPETMSEAPKQGEAPPVCWQIEWQDRIIGRSAMQSSRTEQGRTQSCSVVSFDRLPVKEMATQLLGPLGKVVAPLLQDNGFDARMVAATRLSFDDDDDLEGFHTAVSLGDNPPSIHINGRMMESHKLDVTLKMSGFSPANELYRREIPLPPDALVGDTFSPNPRLKGVRVGQRWTIPVYRPFPPNSPMRILAAEAVREEKIVWGDDSVETVLVEYRDEAGSGITAARAPIARTWVRSDGEVLRQEVMLANLKLTFNRVEDSAATAELVQEENFRSLLGEAGEP